MRRWLTGLALVPWLLLAACGGGQNAQTQDPQTGRGITDTTQLSGGARAGNAAAPDALPAAIRDLVPCGETALALTAEGLAVLDWHNPAEPKVITTVLLGSGARRVAASGTRAYVACGENGLKVVDLSKPRQPQIVGTYAPATGGVDLVAAEGDLVLAGLGPMGVAIVDVSEPSAPAERKRLANLKSPRDLALAGRFAYVLGDKLTVLDLSKPTEARVAATFDPKDKGLAVALVGKRALLASAKQCQLLDITTPDKPARLATLTMADIIKQFPAAKSATADQPVRGTSVPPNGPDSARRPEPPAKDPRVRLTAAGVQAALTSAGRTFLLTLGEKAITATAATDELGETTLVVVADPLAAATAAGSLVLLAADGKTVKTLGTLSLLPAPSKAASVATPSTVPPNPPTREGQAAVNAVPEPKPAPPTPTPPAAD